MCACPHAAQSPLRLYLSSQSVSRVSPHTQPVRMTMVHAMVHALSHRIRHHTRTHAVTQSSGLSLSHSLHSRGSAQAQTLHMKNRTCAPLPHIVRLNRVPRRCNQQETAHFAASHAHARALSTRNYRVRHSNTSRVLHQSATPPLLLLLLLLFACDIAMGRALRGQPTPKGPAPCSAATASAPPLFLSSSVCDRFLHVLFVLLRSARVSAPACFCSRPIRRAPPPRRS